MNRQPSRLPAMVEQHQQQILSEWIQHQLESGAWRSGRLQETQIQDQSQQFLEHFIAGLHHGMTFDARSLEWSDMREFLSELSRSRATLGFSPSQVATFVFSLKRPLFSLARDNLKDEAEELGAALWEITVLVDDLGLHTTELYQLAREAVIARQQEELIELSTPVVELWDGVLALPLIGTLDSERTQIVMENLLQRLVETGSDIAVIDITGVPMVDTLVAQHLLKTVAAAQLMGADCIISGIRPQIAQTIVHLGIDLSAVATKASLADAFALALKRRGLTVTQAVQG